MIRKSLIVISKDHKQFSNKTKILMIGTKLIAQVWEKQSVLEKKTKGKTLEKNFLIDKEMKNKIRIPKYWFSLIFQKTLKQIKIRELLAQKLVLKTC